MFYENCRSFAGCGKTPPSALRSLPKGPAQRTPDGSAVFSPAPLPRILVRLLLEIVVECAIAAREALAMPHMSNVWGGSGTNQS